MTIAKMNRELRIVSYGVSNNFQINMANSIGLPMVNHQSNTFL